MSTRANIFINDEEFCVHSDGGDLEDIMAEISSIVKSLKKKVKPSYLKEAIMNAILAETRKSYSWISEGCFDYADYEYEIKISNKGELKVKILQGENDD